MKINWDNKQNSTYKRQVQHKTPKSQVTNQCWCMRVILDTETLFYCISDSICIKSSAHQLPPTIRRNQLSLNRIISVSYNLSGTAQSKLIIRPRKIF